MSEPPSVGPTHDGQEPEESAAPEPAHEPASEQSQEPAADAARDPAAAPPPRPRTRSRARPRRRRLPRHRRSLRRRLLSENLRLLLSLTLSLLIGVGLVAVLSAGLNGLGAGGEMQLSLLMVMLIVTMSAYSLSFAGLTLWALTDQPRPRMLAAARLPRARRHVRFYRWYMGRSSSASEVTQMLMMAVIAALLLIVPPPEVPIAALLALTAVAVVTAWIGTVVTFAAEYAAEDSRGTAFALPGTAGPDRTIGDYVYGAVLIQASSGTGDLTPLTAPARSLVRHHVILAHVTSTIIVTLGVSAVVTAVA